MPSWARAKPAQPAAQPKKPAKQAAPQAPTIRDDAWWVERMREWRKDDPQRAFPRGKLNLWLELTPEGAVRDALTDDMPTNLDQVLDRMVSGESLGKIAEHITELFGVRVSHFHLRSALTNSPTRLTKYNLARQHLAHLMVDEAMADAESARRHGDFRYSGDFRLKLAGKLNPEAYSDKAQVELTGAAGGPVAHSVVPGQSPADAMKAMLG